MPTVLRTLTLIATSAFILGFNAQVNAQAINIDTPTNNQNYTAYGQQIAVSGYFDNGGVTSDNVLITGTLAGSTDASTTANPTFSSAGVGRTRFTGNITLPDKGPGTNFAGSMTIKVVLRNGSDPVNTPNGQPTTATITIGLGPHS